MKPKSSPKFCVLGNAMNAEQMNLGEIVSLGLFYGSLCSIGAIFLVIVF